ADASLVRKLDERGDAKALPRRLEDVAHGGTLRPIRQLRPRHALDRVHAWRPHRARRDRDSCALRCEDPSIARDGTVEPPLEACARALDRRRRLARTRHRDAEKPDRRAAKAHAERLSSIHSITAKDPLTRTLDSHVPHVPRSGADSDEGGDPRA